VHRVERTLARPHPVQERPPGLPVGGPADERGPGSDRLGRIRAQALADRGEREAPVVVLVEHPHARQRPQDAVQRGRVGRGLARQRLAVARTVAQEIGDAQRGGDVDGLRDLIAVGQAAQGDRGRLVVMHPGIIPPGRVGGRCK